MSRPSFFKEKKPEVLLFVKGLSRDYRQKGDPLSLNLITKKLRAKFKFLPPAPPPPVIVRTEIIKSKNGKPDRKVNIYSGKTDPLKLVVYRLCNSNSIWFGDPERTPSRMKAAPPQKKKKA
jgi:hypothetical protein